MTAASKILMVISFLLAMSLIFCSPKAQELKMAPGAPERTREVTSHTGFVPPPMDLSHLTGRKLPQRFKNLPSAPPQWDWRTQGMVTSVKSQGGCGACYAFASLGNIESKMLMDGAGTYDFSENSAKECSWYETGCGGGDYTKMANWFSKKGTVLESCDPYVPSDVSCDTTCPYIKTLLDWRMISGNSIPETSLLQDYIYNYGPVYAVLYTGDTSDPAWESECASYDGSYTLYYTGNLEPNHAVLIVGWDDSLSHDGGSGAWIVKNCWGTDWGGTCGYGSERGYFTIAYGSANIGMYASYMDDWQDFDPNGEILYYDEGGWGGSWGYGHTTAWVLGKFVPSSACSLNRIEFWTTDVTTDVDVYIYDDFDGSAVSNLLANKLDTSYAEAGYHSVDLDLPLEVVAGEDIYAVVKFTNESFGFPVAADAQGPYETEKTYIGPNGIDSWIDLGTYAGNDVAVRVRLSGRPTLAVDSPNERLGLPRSFVLQQNYPNPFNPATEITYFLPTSTHVNISVYNILGERLDILVDEEQTAGHRTIRWNGGQFASGIYICRLTAGGRSQARKMVLLK